MCDADVTVAPSTGLNVVLRVIRHDITCMHNSPHAPPHAGAAPLFVVSIVGASLLVSVAVGPRKKSREDPAERSHGVKIKSLECWGENFLEGCNTL